MNWEIRIDIYTVPYVKQVASGNRELSFVLCDDLDGWEWEAGSKGRGDICVCVCVCIQLIHFVVQRKLTQHRKAIIPELKKSIENLMKFTENCTENH